MISITEFFSSKDLGVIVAGFIGIACVLVIMKMNSAPKLEEELRRLREEDRLKA